MKTMSEKQFKKHVSNLLKEAAPPNKVCKAELKDFGLSIARQLKENYDEFDSVEFAALAGMVASVGNMVANENCFELPALNPHNFNVGTN